MKIGISTKLVGFTLGITAVGFGILGLVTARGASDAMRQREFEFLEMVRLSRQQALEEEIRQQRLQVDLTTTYPEVIRATTELTAAFQALPGELPSIAPDLGSYRTELAAHYASRMGHPSDDQAVLKRFLDDIERLTPEAIYLQTVYLARNADEASERQRLAAAGGACTYHEVHARYHALMQSYTASFRANDLIVCTPDGDIVYSTAKETDFATNLREGPYQAAGIAEAFEMAMRADAGTETAITDFSFYTPSGGKPQMFMSAPIDAGGERLGVLIAQFNDSLMQGIIADTLGLGETGECVIVGADMTMRSGSRFLGENTLLTQQVKTDAIRKALAGESGTMLQADYRDVPVLVSYGPLDIPGLDWVIDVKRDQAEIFAPLVALRNRLFTVGLITFAVVTLAFVVLLRLQVIRPVHALAAGAERIRRGDYAARTKIRRADEFGALGTSFDQMAESLERDLEVRREAEEDRWVKVTVAEVIGALQHEETVSGFGRQLLARLAPLFEAAQAALFVRSEFDGRFHLAASYADGSREDAARSFAPGEGLVGQCAADGVLIRLDSVPEDYLHIRSGLGEAAPQFLLTAPFKNIDRVLAVLEIAAFRPLPSREQELLTEIAAAAALNLEILTRNVRTRELLAQSQEQARMLEEQAEELTQSQLELLSQREELLAQQHELTEQREYLEVSEERTRLILESSADGVFGVDTEGRITFVNPAACEILGYTNDELIGQPSHDTIHHHHADGSAYPVEACPMYAAYKFGDASRIDNEFLWRKDGSGVPVEYGATPIQKDGAVIGAVISFTDTTERKQAQDELNARSEELQRINFLADSALDLTKSGYWHVPLDDSGYYNSSERASRIFGDIPNPEYRYSLEEWAAHVAEGDEAAAKVTAENFRAAVAGEIPVYDAVYAYKRPLDGRVVWIHAMGHVVKDESGKPADMYGVTQDITDFKQLETELVAAKELAEEATKAKSNFLANMSHEIRTPMNAVIGLSHLALKTPLNPKQRDYVSKIHNAGTTLLGVINDILDFSKIEAGKLNIETVDFRIDDVLTSVVNVTGQKAHEKGLEFLIEVPNTVPQNLLGDPLRLQQVLTNLINNAIKFTEQGEIHVKAEMLERTGDRIQMKFAIQDTGMGMTQEQASRLFQPFTQADSSTSRKHGGTGLGLTICRRLVELMGGQIWLQSDAGTGSTFFFTVWLGVGAEGRGARVVPAIFDRLRVLVVDDNASAREIMEESLAMVVKQVDSVSSGAEAIAAIAERDTEEPYDIVFMDWRMPGMDGIKATRIIKENAALNKTPAVVMVTAFGREEVREQAESVHVDDFIVKPVTKSMLVDSLMNVFAPAGEISGETEQSAHDHGVRLDGAQILLAEDNDINQQIAVELLEGVGAAVDVAENGRIAVERLFAATKAYDFVLMDLQMPEMDGFQATAKIRSDSRFTKLPVIAMTAHATVEERQRCLDAGMNDHISKPIDPAAMYDTLGRFYRVNGAPEKHQERAAAPRHELPEIEGINAADGLRRVAGNTKLFLSLLRRFAEQQDGMTEQIGGHLDQNDMSTAERLAHTLKGVAGNIGAAALQAQAGDIEAGIREGRPRDAITASIAVARQTLQQVVDAIRSAVPPEETAPIQAEGLDWDQVRSIVARLESLLAEDDAEASEVFSEAEGALRAALGTAAARIDKCLRDYDFETALTQLREAKARIAELA